MNEFEWTLHRAKLQLEAIARTDREVMDGVFEEQRNKLLVAYLKGMRIHREIQKRNALFPNGTPFEAKDIPPADWLNAAILILGQCDEDTQKFFVSLSMENKNELVQAVLKDGGIWIGDYFAELPPL